MAARRPARAPRGAPALLCAALLLALAARASADACQCSEDKWPQWTWTRREGQYPIDDATWPLHNATAEFNVLRVRKLLDAGADPNSRGYGGYTPLQIAMMTTSQPNWHPYLEGMYKVAKLLLAKGADPNAYFPADPYNSTTPLLWAAYDGRVDLVEMMLKASKGIMKPDLETGATPLHEAATCNSERSWDYRTAATAKLLLAWGADPKAKNKYGKTPYDGTPGKESNCASKFEDRSDCPSTCKVLQQGIGASEAAAIKAGQVRLDDHSRKVGACCTDAKSKEKGYSQCCLA